MTGESPVSPSSSSYDPLAKSLHWLMALLIIGLWSVGLMMEALPKGEFRGQVFGLHKAFGVVVLALALIRLGWRMTRGAPALPKAMTPFERNAARLGHLALYGLMILLPVDGILLSQSAGRAVTVLGWQLPTVIGKHDMLNELFEEAHGAMAWMLAAVVAVHAAAALRHHLVLKDDVLRRMLPQVRRG